MTKDVLLEASESEAGTLTVLYWKVEEGMSVLEGDELLVLESDEEKTALTVLAPHSGVLTEITAREESKVEVGDLLGRIGSQ
ncbi:lipoyl domain-containing protein [bacterium]|nr:lipoyl domain-containing protein [bacterium]